MAHTPLYQPPDAIRRRSRRLPIRQKVALFIAAATPLAIAGSAMGFGLGGSETAEEQRSGIPFADSGQTNPSLADVIVAGRRAAPTPKESSPPIATPVATAEPGMSPIASSAAASPPDVAAPPPAPVRAPGTAPEPAPQPAAASETRDTGRQAVDAAREARRRAMDEAAAAVARVLAQQRAETAAMVALVRRQVLDRPEAPTRHATGKSIVHEREAQHAKAGHESRHSD